MENMRWYVAATATHLEDYACRNLVRQGFRVFVPRRKTTVKHARKLTTKHTVYFPGYIFVSLDLQRDRWRSVNGTQGVKYLLNEERPVPVPTGFVEMLIESSDSYGLVDLSGLLTLGATVMAAAGPFVDCVGILDRIDGEGRVRVLFEVMQRTTPVLMNRADLMETV